MNLRKALNDYYEGLAIESVKKGDFQVEYFTNELLKWVTENMDLVKMKLLKEDDLIGLQNKIVVYKLLVEQKINSYKLLVEDSKKLKLDIEKTQIMAMKKSSKIKLHLKHIF